MLQIVGYIILGMILVMVPGFLFSTVLYPKNENLDFWTRMGVSLGLGSMLAAFVGFSIAMPGIRSLSLEMFTIATLVVCIVLGILTYLRGGFTVLAAYRNRALKILRRQKAPLQQPPTEPTEQPQTTA